MLSSGYENLKSIFLPKGLEELFEMVRFECTDKAYDLTMELRPIFNTKTSPAKAMNLMNE